MAKSKKHYYKIPEPSPGLHYREKWEQLTGKSIPVPVPVKKKGPKPKKAKKKKKYQQKQVPELPAVTMPPANRNINQLWRWDTLEDVAA